MQAFGPLSTEFHAVLDRGDPHVEIDWYASRLPIDRGPVLEALCGHGRMLVPLLARGFHVHGVDRSAAMIAACEARVQAAPDDPGPKRDLCVVYERLADGYAERGDRDKARALGRTIVTLRESRGGFSAVDELIEVAGIGPELLARLKPRLRV